MKSLLLLIGAAIATTPEEAFEELTEAQKLAASLFYLIPLDAAIEAVTVTGQTACVDGLRDALMTRLETITAPSITYQGFCVDDKSKADLVTGLTADAGSVIRAAYTSTTGGDNCLAAYLGALVDKAISIKAEVCAPVSSASAVTAGLATLAVLMAHIL